MNLKYKKFEGKEMDEYIKNNHGKLVENPYFKHCNFYECDNNTLIIENTIEKNATLYYNRSGYYADMEKIKLRQKGSPLKNQQTLVKNIDKNVDGIIENLFCELGLSQPTSIESVDLKELDHAINLYGYEKLYNQFYLSLVVFAGEYIKAKKGGEWIVENNKSYPSELTPILVDSSNRRYELEINNQIQKQFLEKGSFSIEKIIDFALLPKLKVSKLS